MSQAKKSKFQQTTAKRWCVPLFETATKNGINCLFLSGRRTLQSLHILACITNISKEDVQEPWSDLGWRLDMFKWNNFFVSLPEANPESAMIKTYTGNGVRTGLCVCRYTISEKKWENQHYRSSLFYRLCAHTK